MVSNEFSTQPIFFDWGISDLSVAEDFMRASVSDCKMLCFEIRRLCGKMSRDFTRQESNGEQIMVNGYHLGI